MNKASVTKPNKGNTRHSHVKSSKAELVTAELQHLISAFQHLPQKAFLAYSPTVDSVIEKQSQNKNEIEHLLDGILGFCSDYKMLALFKKLCRYFYTIDPVATAEYVCIYREMWDE
jgi:hypothetical protein